jgi:nicotinamidase-related amidase
VSLETLLPLTITPAVALGAGPVGLIIVDAGVAFTREGNLSDPVHMVPMVGRIATEYRALKAALGDRLHVLCFLDTHEADIPEPPYPPHGIKGTGEELIDPDLAFLLDEPRVTVIRKDCINGFVGAIDRETGVNQFTRWVIERGLETLLVTGDCTARDPADRAAYVAAVTGLRVVVLAGACETFHAPGAHDRPAAHHAGLWMMASRGAVVAEGWTR